MVEGTSGWDRFWLKRAGLPGLALLAGTFGFLADNALGRVGGGDAGSLDLQFGLWQSDSFEGRGEAFTGVFNHLRWDTGFILAYTATLMALVSWRWSADRYNSRRRNAILGLLIALALADFSENFAISVSWTLESTNWGIATYWLALAKWILVPVTVFGIVFDFRHRAPRPLPGPNSNTYKRIGPGLEETERRIGICLSGGGIRSATFGLGSLHGLGNERVRNARYLAAVSGGAYAAAAMSVNQGNDPNFLPFGAGSAELQRLRARSSYLQLNGAAGRLGVVRVTSATVVNLVVLFLVLFAVARPIGWVIRSEMIHPELRGLRPLVFSISEIGSITDNDDPAVTVTQVSTRGARCEDGSQQTYWSFEPAQSAMFSVQTKPTPSSRDGTSAVNVQAAGRNGVISTCGPLLSIISQPFITLEPAEGRPPAASPELLKVLRVEAQPQYEVETKTLDLAVSSNDRASAIAKLVKLKSQLVIAPSNLLTERPSIKIDGWMWGIVVGLTLIAVAILGLPLGVIRGRVGTTTRSPALSLPTLGGAALFALIMIVLPWLMQELPRMFEDVPGLLTGTSDPNSTIGRWVSLLLSALASGWLGKVAVKRSEAAQKSLPGRVSLAVVKVASMALLVLVIAAGTVQILNQAALNGPSGRGSGEAAANVPTRFWFNDLSWWLFVVGILLFMKELVPAHAWSLQPFYRDRLAAAFLDPTAPPDQTTSVEPFIPAAAAASSEVIDVGAARLFDLPTGQGGWPELVICCAANVNKADDSTIPARRWADSMTFSPTTIGGPTFGYMNTVDYVSRLSARRQADLDVSSLVATSGAAFSPGMGKFDFGAIGGLFAVANLRLGVWLPNPLSVISTMGPGKWRSNPGWPYLLREVLADFRHDGSFLYVTDGGHWENLGLVELLRRQCTEIFIVSAAGDGSEFFSTFGDAVALAREQTGVEVHLDPSVLRPLVGAEAGTDGRQLLRRSGDDVVSVPIARRPFAVGWFELETDYGCRRGRVMFIEAALTDDMPMDVHTYAEGNPVFPDHPTANQTFDHRTFEAYRRLGEFQAAAGVVSPEWNLAGLWVESDIDTATLIGGLSALSGYSPE